MMRLNFSSRIKFSLLNLCIVALIGVLMRYKIGFVFPHFEQINLQHAHSHFAFYGWITHTLMTLMIAYLENNSITKKSQHYNLLLISNLICSYGMLIAFLLQGYSILSIFFSVVPIFIAVVFTILFIKDTIRAKTNSDCSKWFYAAMLFNLLSSIGSISITYMMLTKNIPQHLYLAATYFYLHFQYNGWFFFASVGFIQLYFQQLIPTFRDDKKVFWMFFFSCIPAYFLSALWMNLPMWLYGIVVIAALTQFVAWLLLLKKLIQKYPLLLVSSNKLIHCLFVVVCIALTIKFSLQLGSVIPFMSKLAFGFRPVVIAYLHLVLLAIITVFLLTYLLTNNYIQQTTTAKIGLSIFVAGIYLTEISLAIQGIASFGYIVIPFIHQLLFSLSTLMFLGVFLLLMATMRARKA